MLAGVFTQIAAVDGHDHTGSRTPQRREWRRTLEAALGNCVTPTWTGEVLKALPTMRGYARRKGLAGRSRMADLPGE